MGFASGSMSFRRYAVIGNQPDQIDQEVLDKLSTHALKESDYGVPEEEEYGWSGGRHVLDATYSFENNVYAEALIFGLRIDTNKVPGDMKKAYTIMEEDAAAKGNPSGFISKLQKREAKDVVRRKVDDDLRSGKYRRSKVIPVLWDIPSATLYTNASATSQDKLQEIFERSFDLQLQPLSSGSLALRYLESKGKRRDYEDARPTRFANGPEGESQVPEYPWTAKGDESKDFLGNEFLLWLWHQADIKNGLIDLDQSGANGGDATVFFDKSLDLDCSYGMTGRDSLRGDGVTRMPEAMDALRSGKVPRKAGLTIESAGVQYYLSLSGESFTISSLKLPEVEEAENPRVLFEERIAMLREFTQSFDQLFNTFLQTRMSAAWEGQTSGIRKWISRQVKGIQPVMVEVG